MRGTCNLGRVLRTTLAFLMILYVLGAHGQPRTVAVHAIAPVLTFYAIADDSLRSIDLELTLTAAASHDRLLIWVLDADENVVLRRHVELRRVGDAMEGAREVIPLQFLGSARHGSQVVQIRVASSSSGSIARLIADRDLPVGFSVHNSALQPTAFGIDHSYVYVPPNASSLKIQGAVRLLANDVHGSSGGQRSEISTAGSLDVVSINLEPRLLTKDRILKLEFLPSSPRVRMAGFSIIHCNSAEAARRIKASIEVLPDGTVVQHKFQVRLAEAVPLLLEIARSESTESLLAKLRNWHPGWLVEPTRSIELLGVFGPWVRAADALSLQVLEPDSPWRGAYLSTTDRRTRYGRTGHWDRIDDLVGTYAGLSDSSPYGAALAVVATTDSPFNELFGNRALIARAILGAITDLLVLDEGGSWPRIGESPVDIDPYVGFMAFSVVKKNFPEFGLLGRFAPTSIRADWEYGLRLIFDRYAIADPVDARNQSAQFLVGWAYFASAAESPDVPILVDGAISRFVASANEGGYFPEQGGPDAGYAGITHWSLALVARLLDSKAALEALRRSYDFYAHTVTSEPDGTMSGYSSLSHRTDVSFVGEYWGGARRLAAGRLPEVAAWAESAKFPVDVVTAAEQIRRHAAGNPVAPGLDMFGALNYRFFETPLERRAMWPLQARHSSCSRLGAEITIRTTEVYSASIFHGRPAVLRDRPQATAAIAKIEESPFDPAYQTVGRPSRNLFAFNGGGLGLLSTSSAGAIIASSNASPLLSHGVVQRTSSGSQSWVDYDSVQHNRDSSCDRVDVQGRLRGSRTRVARSVQLLNARIVVELTIGPRNVDRDGSIVEIIPIQLRPGMEFFEVGLTKNDRGPKRSVMLVGSGVKKGGLKVRILGGNAAHELRVVKLPAGRAVARLEIVVQQPGGPSGVTSKLVYELVPFNADGYAG